MRTVCIDEARAFLPGELHGELRRALGFPDHYGGNLAALSDCLGDVDEPTRLVVRRLPEGEGREWFDGFCRVLERSAEENGMLELVLAAGDATVAAEWLEGEKKMESVRLDLTEDATRQRLRDDLLALLDDGARRKVTSAVAGLSASDAHFHDVGEVYDAIGQASVPRAVKDDARAVYRILAEAEASVHGCLVEETHFHEVGNASAVANVLAVCLAVEALGRPLIVATPVQTGKGKVRCAHGLLDIPAPATAAILARGIPVARELREGEWCTPTSAALILHFVDRFEC